MAVYYVATPANGGNDANPGTIGSPWGSWAKLGQSGLLQPGDIVNIRGGTYRSGTIASDNFLIQWNYIIGTAGSRIIIQNYQNEVPIMDFDDVLHTPAGVIGLYMVGCEYLTLKGLRIRGLFQNPNHNSVSAVEADNSVGMIFENMTVYDIGGYAFVAVSGNNMTWKNCDAYNLYDPYNITPIAYNGASGFNYSATTASGITTYDGCRVWNTSDNGFQFFNCTIGTKVIIKNCWAFDIGFQENQSTVSTGDGIPFKLGPNGTDEPTVYKFEITNCIAANSTGYGFDPNANSNRCLYKIYNCLAIGQNFTGSGLGFGFGYWSNSLTQPEIKNNIAINNTTNIQGTDINGVTNSWTTGFTPVANTADFTSLSSTQLKAARQADGSLPDITSFKLVGGSDLINAGTNVGLPFNGPAPDLGAFEFASFSEIINNSFFLDLLRLGIIASSKNALPLPLIPCSDYNISTGVSLGINYNFFTQSEYTIGAKLNAAGTKMFMNASNGNQLYVYSITGGNVSTATFDGIETFAQPTSFLVGFDFSEDGTSFYVNCADGKIYQYSLSTPYVLSTKTYVGNYDYSAQTTNSSGLEVSTTAGKFFIMDNTTKAVLEFSMTGSTISTGSFVGTIPLSTQITGYVVGFTLSECGTALYAGSDSVIFQYTLPTAFSNAGASYSSLNFNYQTSSGYDAWGIHIRNGVLYVNIQAGLVYEYILSV
jgi:hypothetical protein